MVALPPAILSCLLSNVTNDLGPTVRETTPSRVWPPSETYGTVKVAVPSVEPSTTLNEQLLPVWVTDVSRLETSLASPQLMA